MKIRISILCLIIPVFLHFGGWNAVDGKRGPIRTAKRNGKAQGAVTGGYITVTPDRGNASRTIFYGMIPIQVWLDRRRAVRKAYFPNCRIPQGPFYRLNSFLIRSANLQGTILVAYVDQERELIGVKPPNMSGWNSLRPNATQWYINHYALKFRLFVNPQRRKVYRIELLSGNGNDYLQDSFRTIIVAGIQFNMFRDTNGIISGARLIQDYYYTVG